MTREQDLIAAFSAAIRKIGVAELKNTTMFGRGNSCQSSEQVKEAA